MPNCPAQTPAPAVFDTDFSPIERICFSSGLLVTGRKAARNGNILYIETDLTINKKIEIITQALRQEDTARETAFVEGFLEMWANDERRFAEAGMGSAHDGESPAEACRERVAWIRGYIAEGRDEWEKMRYYAHMANQNFLYNSAIKATHFEDLEGVAKAFEAKARQLEQAADGCLGNAG